MVASFIQEFQAFNDNKLTQIVLNSVLVGVADRRYVLIQHETDLYMVDIIHIARGMVCLTYVTMLQNVPFNRLYGESGNFQG